MARFENASREQVEGFVKQWLVKEGYDPQPHTDENSLFNYWILKANLKLNIGQPKDSEDAIMIIGNIHFKEEEKNMLRYLKVKRELLYELDIVFTLSNIGFSVKHDVSTEEFTIEDIRLHKIIYYDALTKQSLYDALNLIFNCLKLTIDKFNLLGRSSTNLNQ
jgi:hypothetical protein